MTMSTALLVLLLISIIVMYIYILPIYLSIYLSMHTYIQIFLPGLYAFPINLGRFSAHGRALIARRDIDEIISKVESFRVFGISGQLVYTYRESIDVYVYIYICMYVYNFIYVYIDRYVQTAIMLSPD